ncbi:MAG: hypothetical protein ABR507_04845 [Actinomycetota bacterium]|nr:hypothetical protein [Actinomycetota bacterium]
MYLFPLAAAVVALLFAIFTSVSYFKRHKPHQLTWTIAMLMFCIASLAASIGMLQGWSPLLFRTYFLFGAIVNVPVLSLGTIYLLAPKKVGHLLAMLVAVLSVFSAGIVYTAKLKTNVLSAAAGRIPRAHAVLENTPILLARYMSSTAFIVIVAGALWSAWKLSRKRDEYLRRLASANILIAVGTFVVAAGSGAAGIPKLGRAGGAIFAVALLIGISIMFLGFLRTKTIQAPVTTKATGDVTGEPEAEMAPAMIPEVPSISDAEKGSTTEPQ